MRELWVEIKKNVSPELRKDIIQAVSSRCNVILSDEEFIPLIKNYGIKVASHTGGDISIIDYSELEFIESFPKPCCVRLLVKDGKDEENVLKAAEVGVEYVAISCHNWKIIPLENIIAKVHGSVKILAEVSTSQEAKVALETLELGVDGIILKTSNLNEIKSTLNTIAASNQMDDDSYKLQMVLAKIVSCKQLSLGARACVDTCDIMVPSEGMLLGCSSSNLFLVQAEVQNNPYVSPRPFRVNAGPVSLYILSSENKTRYLSELRSGDKILIVDRTGRSREAIIARVKIERRPLMLVEAEVEGALIKLIVQNAETIHLVTKDGSKAVTDLKPGDEVLVFQQPGGRHFGTLVEEETALEL